jgi:hypothetical protein
MVKSKSSANRIFFMEYYGSKRAVLVMVMMMMMMQMMDMKILT